MDIIEKYVSDFNKNDYELYQQSIPNDSALDWMKQNIPIFECPDKEIEEIYYFRWWTFRKHIKETPDGFVITEFLPPVPWAGKHNTINCPAAHHFREGRWLKDKRYLRDYAIFWLRRGGALRRYSFWIADSLVANSLVSGDRSLPIELLSDLIRNYRAWEETHRDPCGLYWQQDGLDGMENSIGGGLSPMQRGYRATINSYMFGDAMAIGLIAEWAGQDAVADEFRSKAKEIKCLTEEKLWDSDAFFFKVSPRIEEPGLADVRELHGYTPWYFHMPDSDKSVAWKQLMDPAGFYAPFGPTTAERRHKDFRISYQRGCRWDGPSWPFSTAITLTGMANLLNDYKQDIVKRNDYFDIFKIYTKSHRLRLDDGRTVPWIDENLNPFAGDWLHRNVYKLAVGGLGDGWKDGKALPEKGQERGKDYNHSTYCDLVINGLVGLRPQANTTLTINPLVPENWDYFFSRSRLLSWILPEYFIRQDW